MLDVYLRSQVRAISVVLVICDLFGTNFYCIDEIYDLICTSNKKLTRGIEVSKDFLSDSLRNEEIKIVLREILNGVIEYDTKWSGSKNSVTNPYLKHITIRYNMKHDMILDKIVELYEIKEQEMSDYCSKEELIFFGRQTVCLNFSDKELITILKTNLEIRLDIYLKRKEANRLLEITNAPRPSRQLETVDYSESTCGQRSATPTNLIRTTSVDSNSVNSGSARSANGRFGSSGGGSTMKTTSSSSLPPRPGPSLTGRKRSWDNCFKDYEDVEVNQMIKKHLIEKKGITDEGMIDRLLDETVSKSTRTRSFLNSAFEADLQSRVSLTIEDLEEKQHALQNEIRRLKASLIRAEERRAEEIALSIKETSGNFI